MALQLQAPLDGGSTDQQTGTHYFQHPQHHQQLQDHFDRETAALHRTLTARSTDFSFHAATTSSHIDLSASSPGGLTRRHSNRRPRPTMATISPEEFNSLPPSIQKKYFSSVERLRIAQQSAAQKRKKQQAPTTEVAGAEASWLSTRRSMDIGGRARPKSAHSLQTSSFSQYLGSTPPRPEPSVDKLLALPDKVKRSFAVEEIAHLTEADAHSPRFAPSQSATDEPHRRRVMTTGRNSSVTSSSCRSARSMDLMEHVEKDSIDLDMKSCSSLEFSRPSNTDMHKSYERRRQDSICSAYSALPPLPSQSSPNSNPTRKTFSRQRALSLAPLPLPPPRLTPAVPPLPSPTTLKTFHIKALRSADMAPQAPESVPSTKYYKDTHARQKLRDYLSNPEKFDEAVEFGFPSELSTADRSSSPTFTNDSGPHMENDASSNAHSKDNDDGSSIRTPRTPSLLSEACPGPVSQHPSVDSGVALPSSGIKPKIRSLTPDIDGRQMTLRMTLTRPELRAPEEELYSFQRKELSGVDVDSCDPLALEPLVINDDHTGMQGAFALSPRTTEKTFKKMWKTIRGRCPM